MIKKWQVLTKNFSRGFTLIELLTVMAILAVVGGVVGGVFMGSLRGTNKTNNIAMVRQNGNYALTQMANTIRFAENVEKLSLPENGLKVFLLDKPLGFSNEIIYTCDTSGIWVTRTSDSNAQTKAPLIDNSSVDVMHCTFDTSLPGKVVIDFRLDLDATNRNSLVENNTPIDFSTTVNLRNVSNE